MMEFLESRMLLSRTWFVSPGGSNFNPGTITQPLQTIEQAATLAQPGDTVFLRAGIYHETVTPQHSGTAAAPITYSAYDDESVTIDGANAITGWTLVPGSKSIYSAPMPATLGMGNDQIFVNGKAMNEAQWPNTAIGAVQPATAAMTSVSNSGLGVGNGDSATATIAVSNLPGGSGAWNGATIHFGAGQGWVVQTGTVLSSGNGTLTFAYQHHESYETPTAGNRFYLTGKYFGLDAPGEWYRDSTGLLYLEPPTGGNPSSDVVEAKARQYAFNLSGLSYINIRNIHIVASSIETSSASSYITISNISDNYISQQMLNPIGWTSDTPDTGILLLGSNDILENSTVSYSSGNGVYLGGSNDLVENCTIAYTDYSGTDEAAITIVGSGNQALSNYIHDTGRDGILDSDAIAAKIEYNTISAVGHQDTDLGAIYDWGTDSHGTVIAYNTISNIHTGGYGGDGIYLDNGSADYDVHDNTITNVQIPLHLNLPSYDNTVINTTINGKRIANSSSDGGTSAGSLSIYAGSKATLTTLGTLGGFRSDSSGINNTGQVAGTTLTGQGQLGFVFSGKTLTPVAAFGSENGQVAAINASGALVGAALTSGGQNVAFVDTGGKVSSLGTLPGDTSSSANAINDSGQVVGVSYSLGGIGHAFFYSAGKMTSIGTLGGNVSEAFDIDNAGTIVGQSTLPGDRNAHAFVYYDGIITDLGTLGGADSDALAINNNHQIAGASLIAGNKYYRAFLYGGGVMHNLGVLPGYTNSVATGLDSAGDVVGYCYNSDISAKVAFLYRGGKMINLNTLIPTNTGWTLTAATGINDKNQIVGIADASNLRERAFVLAIVG